MKYNPRWYSQNKNSRPESDKKFVTGEKLRCIIAEQLGDKLHTNFGLFIADKKYYLTPLIDAKEIIGNSCVDRDFWTQEKFDCDDFAHVLKSHFAEASYKNGARRYAHCFGLVWGSLPGPHAINWMINEDFKIRFVEPQNDEVYFPRQTDKEIYFMLV